MSEAKYTSRYLAVQHVAEDGMRTVQSWLEFRESVGWEKHTLCLESITGDCPCRDHPKVEVVQLTREQARDAIIWEHGPGVMAKLEEQLLIDLHRDPDKPLDVHEVELVTNFAQAAINFNVDPIPGVLNQFGSITEVLFIEGKERLGVKCRAETRKPSLIIRLIDGRVAIEQCGSEGLANMIRRSGLRELFPTFIVLMRELKAHATSPTSNDDFKWACKDVIAEMLSIMCVKHSADHLEEFDTFTEYFDSFTHRANEMELELWSEYEMLTAIWAIAYDLRMDELREFIERLRPYF